MNRSGRVAVEARISDGPCGVDRPTLLDVGELRRATQAIRAAGLWRLLLVASL